MHTIQLSDSEFALVIRALGGEKYVHTKTKPD